MELFCYTINFLTVTFDQMNTPLLNESINLFTKKK